MASESKSQLITYFNTGDKPTEANFTNLIDSSFNHVTDHHAIVVDDTHVNTVTAANVGTTTIPADTLMAGSVIKLHSSGVVIDNNSTDTLTPLFTLKHGSTTVVLLTGAALDVADSDIVNFESTIQFRTVGASGTFVAASRLFSDAAGGTQLFTHNVSTAVATNVAIELSANMDWSVANADNEFTHLIHTAQVFGSNA